MEATEFQRRICNKIKRQVDYWSWTNDITSPTHISDIREELRTEFMDDMTDEEIDQLIFRIESLYHFIRKFDKNTKTT